MKKKALIWITITGVIITYVLLGGCGNIAENGLPESIGGRFSYKKPGLLSESVWKCPESCGMLKLFR